MPDTFWFERVSRMRSGGASPEAVADELIDALREPELLGLLHGDLTLLKLAGLVRRIRSGPIPAGGVARLGFPGIRFVDGPRGVVIDGSTAFPVTIARAATWDPDLEERVGLAMGLEARARGANYAASVCVNLIRHPAWGRAQESYGDDPALLGAMGAALTHGLRRNVMACVKHFALNSIEDARFTVDVVADEHALHEVYLPHFRAVVDAGADSVMSAYNSVNGEFAGENRTLLTDILREEWGFDGFVTSDWVWGIHDAVASLEAGTDVEMPGGFHRRRRIPAALREGVLDREVVVESARRIIAATARHEAQRDAEQPSVAVVASAEHRALARTVAVRGTVLLQNDAAPTLGDARVGERRPVLPLSPDLRRLAVIGPLADQPNMGDFGSSAVRPPSTSSPLAGIREALPDVGIEHDDGTDLDSAAAAAGRAEVAIVVVGRRPDDEGESVVNQDFDVADLGFPFTLRPVAWLVRRLTRLADYDSRGGDRTSLTLRASDERLILRVTEANPRTVVVVIGGSAIIMESWRRRAPAIVLPWYAGMEGGRALADVLTGAEEPGGRLPLAFPADPAHLPFFDAHAERIRYDAWWGQRMLDRDGNAAAFPLGFGLGYTSFEVDMIEPRELGADGQVSANGHRGADSGTPEPVRVRVANTGDRAGSTVVQLYAVDADADTPIPRLVGFSRVALPAGAETDATVELDLTAIRQRDPETRRWGPRPGRWRIVAAQHSPTPGGLAGAPI